MAGDRRAGGAVRVADLGEGAGCSQGHLVAMFDDQIGLTPKTAARMLRFEQAARMLARGLQDSRRRGARMPISQT